MAKNNTDEFKTKKDKNESRQERRRFKEFISKKILEQTSFADYFLWSRIL